MKGMELAKQFYENAGKPMLQRDFPQYLNCIAAGLVGEGSECFGFDDGISQDHDFGARFCLWLPDDLYKEIGSLLQKSYENLPDTFLGYPVLKSSAVGGAKRSGVFSISGFYENLLGRGTLPEKETDWFSYRESALAAAANGCVFTDPLERFTTVRHRLQEYYPENVRLKKLAGCLAYMAQTGQVNYARSMSRGENFTAGLCINEFIRAAFSVLYLLNRRFMPYYKWAKAALADAPILPQAVSLLEDLQQTGSQTEAWGSGASGSDALNLLDKKVRLIENICSLIAEELVRQGLSDSAEVFLNTQIPQIYSRITSADILRIPLRMPEFMA